MPFDGFTHWTSDLEPHNSRPKSRLEKNPFRPQFSRIFSPQSAEEPYKNAHLFGAFAPEKTKGRYIESDPMGLNAGPNLFAYAGQNPTEAIDPHGLTTITYADGYTETYYTATELSAAISNATYNSILDITLPAHANTKLQGISDSAYYGPWTPQPTDYIFMDEDTGEAMMVGPGVYENLATVLADKMAPDATIHVAGCNAAGRTGDNTPNITQGISAAAPEAVVSGSTDETTPTGTDWTHFLTTGNIASTGTIATPNTTVTYVGGQTIVNH